MPTTRTRIPNRRLRALIAEARWTGQGLARAVNLAAGEVGLALTYDRTAVSHWLAGTRPPAQVAVLVAEVLSRRLGRVVTVSDTGQGVPGMSLPAAVPPNPGALEGATARLIELCTADADPTRRAALHELVYSVSTLSALSGSRRAFALTDAVRDSAPTRRADAVRAMTGFFSQAESRFGGGHVRPAISAYLAGDVAHWLHTPGPADSGPELASAAGELSYLAAFVCFDSAHHGLAQRYYLAALGLAEQAEDRALRATVLRGLSYQAHGLGHFPEALRVAEAAARDVAELAPPQAAALEGQLAVALASTGSHRDAAVHLRRAEILLDRCGAADTPVGAFHRAALQHQTAEVLAARGERRGAIDALAASVRQRPGEERRSRAITVVRLAHLRLDVGHLEAACADVNRLCEDYPYLHSARAEAAVASLSRRLRPFARNPEARAALARIRALRE